MAISGIIVQYVFKCKSLLLVDEMEKAGKLMLDLKRAEERAEMEGCISLCEVKK